MTDVKSEAPSKGAGSQSAWRSQLHEHILNSVLDFLQKPGNYPEIEGMPAAVTYPGQPPMPDSHGAILPPMMDAPRDPNAPPSPFPFEMPRPRVPVHAMHVPMAQLTGRSTTPVYGEDPETYLGAMIPPSTGRAPAWRQADVVEPEATPAHGLMPPDPSFQLSQDYVRQRGPIMAEAHYSTRPSGPDGSVVRTSEPVFDPIPQAPASARQPVDASTPGQQDAVAMDRAMSLGAAGGVSPRAAMHFPKIAQQIARTQVQRDNPSPVMSLLLALAGITTPAGRGATDN